MPKRLIKKANLEKPKKKRLFKKSELEPSQSIIVNYNNPNIKKAIALSLLNYNNYMTNSNNVINLRNNNNNRNSNNNNRNSNNNNRNSNNNNNRNSNNNNSNSYNSSFVNSNSSDSNSLSNANYTDEIKIQLRRFQGDINSWSDLGMGTQKLDFKPVFKSNPTSTLELILQGNSRFCGKEKCPACGLKRSLCSVIKLDNIKYIIGPDCYERLQILHKAKKSLEKHKRHFRNGDTSFNRLNKIKRRIRRFMEDKLHFIEKMRLKYN